MILIAVCVLEVITDVCGSLFLFWILFCFLQNTKVQMSHFVIVTTGNSGKPKQITV